MPRLPDMQMRLRPGCMEFAWGHPDPALLPQSGLLRGAEAALGGDDWSALAYGAGQGPGRLIEQLSDRLGRIDGRPVEPQRLLITAGTSQGLDLICDHLTRPGDVALVESPVYHFALRILRDHHLELLPVEADDAGLRVDSLEERLAALGREGRRARLLYTVPTFSNPTGATLAATRRPALIRLAERHDLIVLEDDVYRELWYDTPPPPALGVEDGSERVLRFGSFSKIIAPGLRLGWLVAPAGLVGELSESGLLTSGGGVSHFAAHVVAEYLRHESLDAHVERLRDVYRRRRDVLVVALREHLPAGCHFAVPGGGFFVWLVLPPGLDSAALLPRAEAAGVSYVPGSRFHVDHGGKNALRLAFSLLSDDDLVEGARRLGDLLHRAG